MADPKKVVALKALIRNRPPEAPDKAMEYPDFNQLVDLANRRKVNWCYYLDMLAGHQYDKCSRMGESDEGNPDPSTQFTLLFVEEPFALQAAARDPERCTILTEAEALDFYENRCHCNEPDEIVNESALQSIRTVHDIAGDLKAADTTDWTESEKKAIDPKHPQPGIVENRRKKFASFKSDLNFAIIDPKDVDLTKVLVCKEDPGPTTVKEPKETEAPAAPADPQV